MQMWSHIFLPRKTFAYLSLIHLKINPRDMQKKKRKSQYSIFSIFFVYPILLPSIPRSPSSFHLRPSALSPSLSLSIPAASLSSRSTRIGMYAMFNFMRGNVYERADGRRLIKAWMCALGVLVSTALGAGDDVAVWTPMASSQRPTPT